MSGYHQLQPLWSLIVGTFLIMNTSTKVVDGLFGSKFPGVVKPSDIVLIKGSTLAIKCTLTTYNATSLRSEALYFESFYNGVLTTVNSTYYHIRNESTMEMVIPDVQSEIGWTFKCFVKDSNFTAAHGTYVGTASVKVGEAPYPIKNISIVSESLNNMTVNWCPERFQEDLVSSTLFWQIVNTGSSNEYSGHCTTWIDEQRTCACVFCSSPASGVCTDKEQKKTFYPYQKYLINITSTNGFGSTSAFVEVDTSPKIAKPAPVSELKVDSIASRQMNISWRAPEQFALCFQISATSRWGEKFVIDAGANTSWTLAELVPHTNYTIAIRCRPVEGEHWSIDSYISGVTLEEAPQVAPNVPIGFFRLSDCSDNCNVTIFLQPIDEKLRNGVIIDYRISVKSGNYSQGQNFFVSRSERTSLVVSIPSNVNNWVELTAHTSVGESPPRFVYFPSYFDRLPNVHRQDLYAEYTADDTGIFIKWNYNENVDNYTLMYCLGTLNDQNNCQGSPTSIVLPEHQTNYTVSTVNLKNHVYSLSANYRNGTNGLTPQWLCVYDYFGFPAKPKLHAPIPVSETSVKISWESLQCNSVNRVRVLKYFLSYAPNNTAKAASSVSITLPENVSEYVITGLKPETPYILTLYAESRSGPGANTTEDIQTSSQIPVEIVVPIIVSVIIVLIVVAAIIVIIFHANRFRKWMNNIDIKAPDKLVTLESPNDSSTVCNPYVTMMTSNSDNPDGFCSSSSTSNNRPTLELCHSESCSSGTSTGTSVICDSIESIRTYTAIHNDEVSLATDYPSYSKATNLDDHQLCEDSNSMPPQSASFGLKLEAFDSCGHGQGKLTDEKLDSDCVYSNSLYKSHSSSSVESLQSDDGYKKTELKDCFNK